MISVILPTYNRAPVLARSVDSVIRQHFHDWELILVDDGSTDQTASMARAWQSQGVNLKYVFTENKGVSHARNLGVAHASGDWLAFIDSDDEWLPEKLVMQVPHTLTHRWVHGEEIWVRHGVRVNPAKKYAKSGGRIFNRCVDICCVSPSSVLMQKSLFEEMGGFREDFPVCEDYALWLKISAAYDVAFVDAPVLVKYGGHEDQLSTRFVAMDYFRAKALHPFLTDATLTLEERSHVAQTLEEKADILIKGYFKHRQTENLLEVQGWRLDASRILFSASHMDHSVADRRPLSESSLIL